ncbi:acetamidase/formamidase family protein [Spongisporangium articulatum]|uniref:Acetamidase/formamidase family protein n=1 Tax=Spongisporangium articulatum TaxID=3362603 RepID=A0ABW8AK93_9ACTN
MPVCTWAPDERDGARGLPGTFGGVGPVATITPGTVLRTRTVDCFGGLIRSPDDLPSRLPPDRVSNPLTGPFHVEGAQVGDTLAVHVVHLRPRGQGVSTTFPHFGALTGSYFTPTLNPPLPERVWIYEFDLDAWTTRFVAGSGAHVDLPLDPMLGTMGVAPPNGEARSSLTPGEWGGNLDTPTLRVGTTAYFRVNVPGALLAFGDGHARQGEGETCGTGIECPMDVVLLVDLVTSPGPVWPRLETDDELFTTGSTKPLEDAFRIAQRELVGWVAGLTGLDELDAYQLLSQVATAPVANVVDTNYTMLAGVRKSLLGALAPAAAYGGVHETLRGRAHQWTRERAA